MALQLNRVAFLLMTFAALLAFLTPARVEALPLAMTAGLRASCGDMDLPATMDQAVRSELARASCGAVSGDGLKFLDPDASDRALSLHDVDTVCLGGVCFDAASATAGAEPGHRGNRTSSSGRDGVGGGGGGGGGGGYGSGSLAGGRGHESAFRSKFGGLARPFVSGAHAPAVGRGGGPSFSNGQGPALDEVPGAEGSSGAPAPFVVTTEPTTLIMLGAGLIAAALATRRFRARRE
jgi:hypothetical protein